MSNYTKKFRVQPDCKIKLSDFSPDAVAAYKADQAEMYVKKMDKLQYQLFSEKKQSILIVLQGMDGSGKDGVVRHVLSGLNPEGC
jgi:polyphosphate kinase 2 (PPK2 family)